MLTFWRGVSVFLSSCFYLSYLPALLVARISVMFRRKVVSRRKWTGAGLVGSAAGVATYVALPPAIGGALWALLLGIAAAVLLSGSAERAMGSHDDSRIVIDEWIGCWIAVWGLDPALGWPLLLAFVLFRIFDVFKGPWGNALQRLPGGWGVTMDDVVAGVIANVLTRAAIAVCAPFAG